MGRRYLVRVFQKAGSHVDVDDFIAVDRDHMERLQSAAFDGGAFAVEVGPAPAVNLSARAKDARATADRLRQVGHLSAARQWLRYAELLEEITNAR